jgi:heterodisulfide reductase subunit D
MHSWWLAAGADASDGWERLALGWLPAEIQLSEQYDTVFFIGCAPYYDIMFGDLEVNTLEGVQGAMRLLNRADIPFNLLVNERCCGHDLLLQGDKEGFMALAQANLDEFNRLGIKKIITACPECFYSLKVDYPKMLGNAVAEVVYWTEVIAPLLGSGNLRLGRLKERAVYHDPCTLGRGLRIFDSPRQILCAVDGLELVEMEQSREKALCCGASSWVHCGAANRQIQDERLAQAKATGADVLVTSCPKCQIHLKCAQRNQNGKMPGIDIQNLAGLAVRSLETRTRR